jgi:MFS family permease
MEKKRKIIYLAGFLFSLPIALAAYINSTFISLFVGEKLSGLIYTFGSISSILGLIYAPKIFRKIGGYKFLLLVTALDALSFAILSFSDNKIIIIPTFILGFCFNTLIVFSLDEILKIFSREKATGTIRGAYLALCSLAWILAQLASGTILGNFSFKYIYLVSFIIMTLFLMTIFLKLKHIPDPEYDKVKSLIYIKNFFKDKNLFRAYGITFLLQFFFSWMVIYTPIYLSSHLGFEWKQIGIIFATMLIPFFIIPFNLGKYSDKIGERKLLMLGFFITGLSTISLFLIKENTVFIWASLLFMTRVGGATLEVMSDSYFFKHIKPENEEYIGVYRSASPVAYIIAPLIAIMFFAFIPSFNFIYLILGGLMLSGVYISSKISKKDI